MTVFFCWPVKPEPVVHSQGATAPWQGFSAQLGQTAVPPLTFIALGPFPFMTFLLLSVRGKKNPTSPSYLQDEAALQQEGPPVHTAVKLGR